MLSLFNIFYFMKSRISGDEVIKVTLLYPFSCILEFGLKKFFFTTVLHNAWQPLGIRHCLSSFFDIFCFLSHEAYKKIFMHSWICFLQFLFTSVSVYSHLLYYFLLFFNILWFISWNKITMNGQWRDFAFNILLYSVLTFSFSYILEFSFLRPVLFTSVINIVCTTS